MASNSFYSEETPKKNINNTWTKQAKIYKSHNLFINIQVFRESGIVTEKITLEVPG
jgi:pectate lyase